MWQTGLSSRVVNETKKKIDTNILGPKNVPPNLIDIVEGKGKGGWAKGRADETRDQGKPLQTKKKRVWGKEWTHPCQWKKRHDLPAILRRWTSRSRVRAIGWSQGSVLDSRVISSVRHRRNMVLKHAFLIGRCQTALRRSNRTTRGTLERTSFSKVCTILNSLTEQCGMSQRVGPPRVLENPPESLIGGEASRGRKETIGGTPHGYTFFVHRKKSCSGELRNGSLEINKGVVLFKGDLTFRLETLNAVNTS